MKQHPDDRSALVVGNRVENFVRFRRVVDRNLNRMRAVERIELRSL